MPLKIEKIEKEVLKLTSHERAMLAERLISSLDAKEDPEAERLWIGEAKRRYKEYKEGKVKAKSADMVFKKARSRIG